MFTTCGKKTSVSLRLAKNNFTRLIALNKDLEYREVRECSTRLLKNRSVSKLHTPFTSKTERNFSRKTLPWLGSGMSSGVGGQLSPYDIRRHMEFGVKAVG